MENTNLGPGNMTFLISHLGQEAEPGPGPGRLWPGLDLKRAQAGLEGGPGELRGVGTHLGRRTIWMDARRNLLGV